MALIGPWSTCAICDGALDRPYTATSGVAFPPDHPLWEFCDAPLHVDCLARWPDREEFSRGYCWQALLWVWEGNGTLLHVARDWFLACHRILRGEEHPRFASVRLATWPTGLSARWGEWDAFVAGGYAGDLAGPELAAADAAMAEVRVAVPSLRALAALHAERSRRPAWAAGRRRSLVEFGCYLGRAWGDAAPGVDWRGLERSYRARVRTQVQEARARLRRVTRSNAVARGLAAALGGGAALTCPHCRRWTHEIRFVERGPNAAAYFRCDAESYFICRACGRSFTGAQGVDSR
jgi:hypothetical protein